MQSFTSTTRKALLISAVLVAGCEVKESSFFDPFTGDLVLDETPPILSNFQPSGNFVVNDETAMFTATDPESGVDVDNVTATANSMSLPVIPGMGSMFSVPLGELPDGQTQIDVNASDLAGNVSMATINFNLDRTGPIVDVTMAPPSQVSSSDAQFTFTVGASIEGPNFLGGFYELNLPGGDGECGTADDVQPTSEQAPQSRFPLMTGANEIPVTVNNGVQEGGSPRTAIYCGAFRAFDSAVTKTGADAHNESMTEVFRSEITWLPPSGGGGGGFNVGLQPSYRHISQGSSETCATITTSPAQPGGMWMTMWSGPGTVGGTTRSGTLDSNGSTIDRQPINQFGTYTVQVQVTAGGITRMGSGSINVGSAQGNCMVASSKRFKRDVKPLLPDGATFFGLQPVTFRYLAPWGDPMVVQVGLIAEEVAGVYPAAVVRGGGGAPAGIDYGTLQRLVMAEIADRTWGGVAARIARTVAVF